MIRITIDFGGAQVRIRERLRASIASGQTIVWQKATHESAAWHPISLPVWQLGCQTPDATAPYTSLNLDPACTRQTLMYVGAALPITMELTVSIGNSTAGSNLQLNYDSKAIFLIQLACVA